MILFVAPIQILGSIAPLISGQPFALCACMAMLRPFIALWDYPLFRRRWNLIVIPEHEFMKSVQTSDRATEEDTILLPTNDNDRLHTTQIDTQKLNSAEEPTRKLTSN
jgi:hypothetical protein